MMTENGHIQQPDIAVFWNADTQTPHTILNQKTVKTLEFAAMILQGALDNVKRQIANADAINRMNMLSQAQKDQQLTNEILRK